MKTTMKRAMALLMTLVLCLGLLPTAALAGNTVEIKKVVYTNGSDGTASAAITFSYTGNNITYIDPMIGKAEGTYEYDLDTREALKLPEGWALKKNEDGTYTLIASPLHLTGGIGKPPAGTEAWVGVSVTGVTGDDWDESSDQLKITIPGEGQTVEVVRGGGDTPTTISIPTGKTLTYDGTTQTGVDAGTGYILSGTYQAINAGSYTATATLNSGYKWSDGSTGRKQISWKINKAALTDLGYPDPTTYTYNGQVQKPVEAGITVFAVSGAPAARGRDYTISYANANSKNAGSYTVTATGAGNFTGSASLTYKIDPTTITGITLSAEAFEFTGQVQKPTVQSITTSNGVALTTNDYTIDIPNSSAVGSYTVTVTGKNNATGTQTAQYVIETEKDLSKATVVGLKKDENGNVDDNQTYTKEEAERIGLEYGGKTLIPGEGKDYIKTVTVKEGEPNKWEIKAEPIEGKTKGQRTIEVKKAGNDVHNVTIHYLYAGTGEVAAPTFLQSYEKGASFAVRSPQLADGSIASNGIIVGTMGDNNLEYTVTYSSMSAATLFTVDVVYTVEYKDGDTTTATPKPVRLYLEDGKTYSVTSPEVAGYKPTIQVVQGKVNHENVIVEVRYKPAYTLCVKMIVKGHNGGADEEYGDRKIPMYAGESYDFVPYLFYGDTSTDVALIGGIEAAVNENYTPDPARVKGVMPADDVTVTVTYTCKHSKTIWKNDGESGHHLECCICSSTLKTEPHDLDDGVYVPLEELFEETDDVSEYDDIRKDYPNGATLKSCSICSYHELTNPDEDRCPASSADENYKHLWGSWEKISDTQCQRTCYRCKTVETANHDWSNWQYASTASHYRICNHCHTSETGNHGSWQNINVKTPATCIAHADVDAKCGICDHQVNGVYYGILKDMRLESGQKTYLPTGHTFDGGWVNIHGGHTQKCSVCGAFDMEHHEEHSWGDWYAVSGETACEVEVTYRRDCTKCNAYETKKETRHHIMVPDPENDVGVSCTEAGMKAMKCIQPGCTHTTRESIPALGHAWVEDEGNYPASCTEPGHMSFHCDRPGCLETKGGDIPALHPEGHKMEPFSINTSTCTIGGYLTTGQKCAYCGYTENTKDEPVDKLGHSMKETEQKVDWRSRMIYQNGRPAMVYEEVFYVTRECTRCGYHAPGHLYTVARSDQLSRYKIETGNVKVKDLDEGSGGVKVDGQFGKDSGVYFNKTVNDAYQTRKEIDRKVYEQHEGSVITTFTDTYLSGLENGEYDFFLTNGDELAGAALTVKSGQITAINGIYSGLLRAQAAYDAGHLEEVEKFGITDGEYLFYLGAADHVMTADLKMPEVKKDPDNPNSEAYPKLALGANSYPFVDPGNAVFDQREGKANHKDVVTIKYDKGHQFDSVTHFGVALPADAYTVSTEGDKFTFTTDYLSTLGEGAHEFEFNYSDAPAALLVINVTSADPVNPVDPGGNGNGGGGGAATYAPAIAETEHGKVTVSPKAPAKGNTVTITATPDEGYALASLTVKDAKGNEVALTKNADGTYTFTQPDSKVTVTAVFRPASDRPFVDVKESDWFYDAVYHCFDNGYFKGTDATHFTPKGTMTRAMFATVLYRIAGEPEVMGMSHFSDVPDGQWYTNGVVWASNQSIIEGYGNGRFGSNDSVTREQMVTIFWRYNGKPAGRADLSGFPDADKISPWAKEAFAWAVSKGVINGRSNGTLDPQGKASRAEVAQIVMNYDTKAG